MLIKQGNKVKGLVFRLNNKNLEDIKQILLVW